MSNHPAGGGGAQHGRGPRSWFSGLERKREPIAPHAKFIGRLVRSILFGLLFVAAALAIGVVGYHVLGGLGWLDSLYNAAMILGGMGPVDARPQIPDAEKWFASAYALFSGIAFLVIVGVMFAPLFHRFLHHFHFVQEDGESR